jgi:hypothetical protein
VKLALAEVSFMARMTSKETLETHPCFTRITGVGCAFKHAHQTPAALQLCEEKPAGLLLHDFSAACNALESFGDGAPFQHTCEWTGNNQPCTG